MTKLRERKTRLTFTTEATVRYRRKEREIVIEVDNDGHNFMVRLAGTQVRYAMTWSSVFNQAAKLQAQKELLKRQHDRLLRSRRRAQE